MDPYILAIHYGSVTENGVWIRNRNHKENPKDLTEKSGVHP